MGLDNRLLFFKGFLRNPQLVASVVPSSRFLERRLAEFADIRHAHTVVELGPGTGGTTQAMLRAMPENARLLAIEISQQFIPYLQQIRDPRLIVQPGSAEHIKEFLRRHDLGSPDVVLSGIPFSTMPMALGRRILKNVWDSLEPGGRFVAYQFRSRVASLARDIMGRPLVSMELFNVPPMRVYRWDKTA